MFVSTNVLQWLLKCLLDEKRYTDVLALFKSRLPNLIRFSNDDKEITETESSTSSSGVERTQQRYSRKRAIDIPFEIMEIYTRAVLLLVLYKRKKEKKQLYCDVMCYLIVFFFFNIEYN